VVPWPQGADVLPFLPPVPVAAVERALQQFLDQLDRVRQSLDGDRGEGGLWPWIVAGAAAGVACEIARRQLRRPTGVSALPGDRLPGPPTETPFTG
jgi:hypothetical protein